MSTDASQSYLHTVPTNFINHVDSLRFCIVADCLYYTSEKGESRRSSLILGSRKPSLVLEKRVFLLLAKTKAFLLLADFMHLESFKPIPRCIKSRSAKPYVLSLERIGLQAL